jgi:hypothetical protein
MSWMKPSEGKVFVKKSPAMSYIYEAEYDTWASVEAGWVV